MVVYCQFRQQGCKSRVGGRKHREGAIALERFYQLVSSTANSRMVWLSLSAMMSTTVWLQPETVNAMAVAMSVKNCSIKMVLGLMGGTPHRKKFAGNEPL